MTALAVVQTAIPVLVELLMPALVPGPPLLIAFLPDAQPLVSCAIAALPGRAIDCRALTGTGQHDITAATPAVGRSLSLDQRAGLQGQRL
jgi:hypothetical protein